MKKLAIIILLGITISSVLGQYPSVLSNGAFMSFSDLMANTASFENSFSVEQRSESDIKMVGGNDFKITSTNPNILKQTINKEFWAIFHDSSIYINGFFATGYKHYCMVENNHRFLVFKAGIPKASHKKVVGYTKDMNTYSIVPVGGAIGGAIRGAQLAMIRFYYVLDSKSGSIKILSELYLNELISEFPDLADEFNSEEDKKDQEVLLKYLNKVNSK